MVTAKTYFITPSEIVKQWVLFDAEGVVLGRLASEVAKHLRGKNKPEYTPFQDMGDNVIIINAEKVLLTGNKRKQKKYFRHTGHPGGIKEITAEKVLDGRFPERVLEKAIERMMPKDSPLARQQMRNLRLYAGAEHPHAAQQPIIIPFAEKNKKNKKA